MVFLCRVNAAVPCKDEWGVCKVWWGVFRITKCEDCCSQRGTFGGYEARGWSSCVVCRVRMSGAEREVELHGERMVGHEAGVHQRIVINLATEKTNDVAFFLPIPQ